MRIIMKVLMMSLICMSSQANPIDEAIRDSLAWEDHKTADYISDYTLGLSYALPFLAFNSDDRKWSANLGEYIAAHAVAAGVTHAGKVITARWRPDGSNNRSFPSGHTSAAFVGAAYACHISSGRTCLVTAGLAATTGYLRIAGRKHWFSDVLVGAAIGVASGGRVPAIIKSF